MDLAYMGDIMAMIVREEWKMNMVGTMQNNQTRANTKGKKKGTAGLAMKYTLGLRHNFCFQGPI